MKKIVLYFIACIIIIGSMFIPYNGKFVEPGINTIQQKLSGDVKVEEGISKAKTIEPSSEVPNEQSQENSSVEESKSEEPSSQTDLEPSAQASELNQTSETDKQTKQIETPIRNAVPYQSENTTVASTDVLNSFRNKTLALINQSSGASYDSDCEQIAKLRASGTGANAGELFSQYGNSVSWYEVNAYDYCISFSDNAINDTVQKIYNNFPKNFSNYDNVGIGVNITTEDEYYRVKIVAVFCS